MKSNLFLMGVVAAVFGLSSCQSLAKETVTITLTSGGSVKIQPEVADTPEKRAQGLMFRKELSPGEGMLFLFPSETQGSFWMRNTLISLDLIFIKSGRIVDMIEEATPNATTLLTPTVTYTSVLEVPGGYVKLHGLEMGNKIILESVN